MGFEGTDLAMLAHLEHPTVCHGHPVQSFSIRPLSSKLGRVLSEKSCGERGNGKGLHRMPVADCGAFEVGERSEVGALESPSSEGMKQRHRTFGAITSAKPTLPLAQRATNMSESE